MNEPTPPKGPWVHRTLTLLFSVTLAILTNWLLGFIVDDIGSWPGPSYRELEEERLEAKLVEREEQLRTAIAETERKIVNQQARQKLLRDSISTSQRTMQQLLEIQRLQLEKDVAVTAEERKAMADNLQRFLANQTQDQRFNEEITQLIEQRAQLEGELREAEDQLDERRVPIRREFETLSERHDLKLAVLKLSVIVPLLIVAVVLFIRHRQSTYVPLIYATGVALALRVTWVMHQHFPTRYFKYILIVVAIAVVTRILIYLLHMVAFPRREWLLKQYQESYEAFLCPICAYPIRRGPLKYLSWNRRSIKRLSVPATAATGPDESYVCPMCATKLYEECESCHAIRHSLLPSCQKCGALKSLGNSCDGNVKST